MQKKLFFALLALPVLLNWACGGGDKTQVGSSAPYAGPPYTVQLEEFVNPNLPSLHAYIQGVYQDKIVMMGGRRNGLHTDYSFKDEHFNDSIFVVNTNNWASPETWTVKKLSVYSDLLGNQANEEQLEANNAQFFTEDSVLYIVGGMLGDDVIKGKPSPKHTSPYITAITLPALINTVNNGVPLKSGSIRQAKDDQLSITGGELELLNHSVKLAFGWKINGDEEGYSHQVRSFTYQDDGKTLTISPVTVCPTCWDNQADTANNGYYRRRDGSLSDMIDPANGEAFLLYYAGVFKDGKKHTPFDNPVWIGVNDAKEIDFSMRSNIYTCKVVPVYSPSRKQSYATLLGGMTNAIYKGAAPDKLPVQLDKSNTTDDLTAPFSNQISTLMIDAQHQFSMYLLPNAFPVTKVDYQMKDSILLAGSVAYNGTGSELFWTLTEEEGLLKNGVINYDDFIKAHPEGGKVGYLHGGILSKKENTFDFKGTQDKLTRASNRIFAVKLVPVKQ
jgi:hypothetical protein